MNKALYHNRAVLLRNISGFSLLVGLGLCVGVGDVAANPSDGKLVDGSASISSAGKKLTVNQQSQRAVIDWKTFDIGKGEHTHFAQPNADSVTLNRVLDKDPSSIAGKLTANGNVVLVNPNGVVFQNSAQVDVVGLIATTADIDNDQFMSGGKLRFAERGSKDARIINHGSITAKEAGLVGLVAPHVENHGVIQAKLGTVHIAAADAVTVDLYGDGLLEIKSSELTQQHVSSSGSIESGIVALTAAEGKQLVDNLIQVDGELSGRELLITGKDANIALTKHADITATNKIKVGGDYLGGGTTPTAAKTFMAAGAKIKAKKSAILWSDEKTDFHGNIEADFVETSSKNILVATGKVEAKQWLLDPNNITVQDAGPDANVTASPTFTSTNDSAIVTTASIETALNAGTDVTVQTAAAGTNAQDGDITINGDIEKTAGGDASLTFKAHRNITANNDIVSTSGELDVVLHTDSDSAGGGVVNYVTATLTTNNGDLTIGGGADPSLNPAIGFSASSNDGVIINGVTINTGTGDVSIRGEGWDDAGNSGLYGVYIPSGTTITTTTGDIDIVGQGGDGINTNLGVYVISAGTEITSQYGDITITGTGGNGSSTNNSGIRVQGAAVVSSTGTGASAGNITMTAASSSTASFNTALAIFDVNTTVSTVDGDITLTGTAGATAGDHQYGTVITSSAQILSTGTGVNAGTITINGTGSANGVNANYGIQLNSTPLISSVDGDITLNATAGGSGSTNYGIYLVTNPVIESTGTGVNAANITITAVAGNGTSSGKGFYSTGSNTQIRTVDGDIAITATGRGNSSSSPGYELTSGQIISTGTGDEAGNIVINATGSATGTSGNTGFALGGSVTGLITTVDGDISITGTGGGTTSNNYGVLVISGASITSTGTDANGGKITLNGVAGGGTSTNYGTYLTGTDTSIETVYGDITITGVGGNGSTTDNQGFVVNSGVQIISSGTGADAAKITLTGTGGTGGTSGNTGLSIATATSLVQSVDGDISITGTGKGSTTGNNGVLINSANIVSTGSGVNAAKITMNGTSSTTGTASNYGTYLLAVNLDSVDGDISITGTGQGSTTSNYGVFFTNASTIDSTGTDENAATITLDGTGGDGTTTNPGVFIQSVGTHVNSAYGDITINGQGGNGSSTNNYGVYVTSSGQINSTGTGANAATIDITGAGGSGNASNIGVYILNSDSWVTSVDGDITLTGTSAGTDSNNNGIHIGGGGLVESTGTGEYASDITLNGTAASGTVVNYGVQITAAGSAVKTVDGDINITGIGAGSGSGNYGFYLNTDADIISAGTGAGAGKITISGTGGDGTLTNYGAYLEDSGTQITTVDGDVTITGTGGNGSTSNNFGIIIETAAQIHSTGTGENAATITLTGTGGTGTSSLRGIYLRSVNTEITSVDGDITITGTGGDGSSNGNQGILLTSGAQVHSMGTGDNAAAITMTGVAGSSTNSGIGLWIASASGQVTSVDGDITLVGAGGGATASSWGFYLNAGASIITTGAGDLSIWGDSENATPDVIIATGANVVGDAGMTGDILFMADSVSLADFILDTQGALTFQNRTAGVSYGLGTGAGTISLTDAILGAMTAGDYVFGSDNAGDIEINSAHNFGAASLQFLSGSDVKIDTDISTTYAGETGITIVSGNSVEISSGSDALSTPNSRWLVYGVSDQHNEMDGVTADFNRYSCRYGATCPTFPATGNGFLYRTTPRLTVTADEIEVVEGDALPSISYTVSGWLNNDEAADDISGSALFTGDVSGAGGSSFVTQKVESTLTSALGYGFTFLDSTGSILQGEVEEVVTPPSLPETTPVTPIPTDPVLEFEAFYGGELITGYSSLPETIQQEIQFSYLDNVSFGNLVIHTSILDLPTQLIVEDELLKYYGLSAQ